MTEQTPPNLGAPLKKILAGNPTFIVHRSGTNQKRVGEVLHGLDQRHGRKLGLGVVARMPKLAAANLAKYFADHKHVPLRIADPELFRRPDLGWDGYEAPVGRPDKNGTLRFPKENPWDFFKDVPSRPEQSWINRTLGAQKSAGATVLLSATGWVDAAKAQHELTTAMSFVTASRKAAGPHPMFVNLTMDYRWLTDAQLRGLLLQEITESQEKHWYLRFWWPLVPVRFGQLTHDDVLRGYRILTRHAALEGKRLFLPNSGLTGWVMSALGATGFSTGTSWDEQAFARQRKIASRPGQKRPPRVPRIFDRQVMNVVEYSEFERLAELPAHHTYSSRFLAEVSRSGHRPELAGLHYLAIAGNLQAKLASGNPSVNAQKVVVRARSFVDGLDRLDKLTGTNAPAHLSAWETLLT